MANREGMEKLVDLAAERAALGAMLIDPDASLKVADFLRADDFQDEQHRLIYGAIAALSNERAHIDAVTVADRLADKDALKKVGGSARLMAMINATPTSMHVRRYAQIVYRLGTLRRLMTVAGDIAKLAYSTDEELGAVFEKARTLVDSAAPIGNDRDVLLWLDSLELFVGAQLERLMEIDAIDSGEADRWAVFPWKGLRHYVSRLRAGTMVIVAAASSVGKTAFLECCAEYWARQGLRTAFFHLELAHALMLDRRMARISGAPFRDIEGGLVDERTDAATAQMREWPGGITYVHCPGWTAGRIVAKARQLHAKGLCDVLLVDYLQKLRLVSVRGQNSADWIGNAVEALKTFAEQAGVPVVLASQFSQAGKQMSRKTALGIRGSGAPENKSNIVITLDRAILEQAIHDEDGEVVARPGERSPVIQARVDKNTTGPTGDLELVINGARFLIKDKADVEPLP